MVRLTRRDFLSSLALAAAAVPVLRSRALFAEDLGTQEPRVWTVAGTGRPGAVSGAAADSAALDTPVDNPYGIVPGPDGALYFCEVDTGRIRRLDPLRNQIATIAGTGGSGYSGDGGPALTASFSAPHELRFDSRGSLFVVERDAHVVRRIDGSTRIVSTVAGTGEAGYSGDGGPARRAQLRQPHSIAFDEEGNLLVCDIGNQRVRIIDLPEGEIRTFAGTGAREATPDEAPIEGTPLLGPRSLDTDGAGNVYLVLREGNAVFRLDPSAGRLERIAGTGETGFTGDGGPAREATFNGPKGIAYSASEHSLYVVDTENHAIRRMSLESGTIETVLGTGERADGPDGDPLRCRLARPHGVCVHRRIVYVTDSENHRVRGIEGIVPP